MANSTNHLHLDTASHNYNFTNHAPHINSSSSNSYDSAMSAADGFVTTARAEARGGGGGGREEEMEITATQKMLAACSGSLLTSLLVTPLDVVRVRLQSQHPTPTHRSSTLLRSKIPLTPLTFTSTTVALPPNLGVTACCREVFWLTPTPTACLAAAPSLPSCQLTAPLVPTATSSAHHRINGTFEGLVKIAKYEGVTSLWRGLSPTLLMAIPANVIYFTGYDSLRDTLGPLGPTAAPLIAGSAARTIAATVISPVELFRTRLQAAAAADHTFASTLGGVRAMVAASGVASLWRGLGLTLWRDVPFSGVYWFGYEMVKARLRREREQQWHLGALETLPADIHAESTFVDAFVAGAASGAVAALLTTPFDVGKTRRQVAMQVGGGGSMPGLLWGIWRAEGVAGLMRGCVPRMLKVAPACAIMISSYEVGKKAAARMNSRSASL